MNNGVQSGVRPGVVLAVAALVAAGVAAVVGGASAWIVTHWGEMAAPETTRVAGAVDQDVALTLTHERDTLDVRFEVPDDAVAVRIRAESSGGPLALRARFGDDAHGPWGGEDAEPSEEPSVDLAEHTVHEFAPGPLVVRVEASRGVDDGDVLRSTLRATVVRDHLDATIDAGGAFSGATTAASGFRRTVAVRVPAGATALRLDIADAATDLDLHVATRSPLRWKSERRDRETTLAAAEWMVLDAASKDFPLPAGGTVFVTVADPALRPFDIPFRLVTTLGEDPPDELATLPELPQPRDPRERALVSVVEVLCDDGGGSGTLVSEDGLVLTARHVVEAAARAVAGGRPDDAPPIVIAVSLDTRGVATDLFLAEVVRDDRDLDLAMLQVVSGVRGTPLPDDYRFPFVRPRRRSATYLGEPLWTVGYPAAGGTGTRVPVTLARGCVSGWDRTAACVEIKTDAFVSPGSSGGAAFDDRWDLIGVPVATNGGDDASGGRSLGNVVPVDAVPSSWWKSR